MELKWNIAASATCYGIRILLGLDRLLSNVCFNDMQIKGGQILKDTFCKEHLRTTASEIRTVSFPAFLRVFFCSFA